MKKSLSVIIIIASLAFASLSSIKPASAKVLKDVLDMSSQSQTFADNSGFDYSATAGGTIAVVIKVFLSILGIIFVVLVILAGYKYMTANGDEGKVEEALDSIRRAVIGLIIIVAAYAITAFVFKNMPSGGGSGGSGSGETPVTAPL